MSADQNHWSKLILIGLFPGPNKPQHGSAAVEKQSDLTDPIAESEPKHAIYFMLPLFFFFSQHQLCFPLLLFLVTATLCTGLFTFFFFKIVLFLIKSGKSVYEYVSRNLFFFAGCPIMHNKPNGKKSQKYFFNGSKQTTK